jgi:hypothetical protein
MTQEQLRMKGDPKVSTNMMVMNVRKPRPTYSVAPYTICTLPDSEQAKFMNCRPVPVLS